MSKTVDRLTSQDLQAISLAIETHMDRYREPVPNSTFNRYSKLMTKVRELMECQVSKEEGEDPGYNCPECGGPATHPSGLCRDCHQGKLEAEEL